MNAASRAIAVTVERFGLHPRSSLLQPMARADGVAGTSTGQGFGLSRAGIPQLLWAPGSAFDHPCGQNFPLLDAVPVASLQQPALPALCSPSR